MRIVALLLAVMMVSSAMAAEVVEGGRVLVGAIRWDAWHGQKGAPGKAVERALGPVKWQDRLPFFAEARGDDDITIDGTAPGVMEKEIGYARQAGLDYWAFVTYGETDSMSIGLGQYLASERRGEINFCLITEGPRWQGAEFVRRAVRLVGEKGYQRVMDGRPLVYVGFVDEALVEKGFGGVKGFKAVMDGFCEQVMANGSKRPYIVIMDWDPVRGERWRREFGADALSSYAMQANGTGATYAELARCAEGFWERCREQGSGVVPVAMCGWDRRPRVERPVPWETWQKPGEKIDRFYQRATAEELAGHIGRAVKWTKEHRTAAPAQTVIIYAWNEIDEGGWLVPTKGEGSTRVEAVGKALREEGRGDTVTR